MKDSVEYHGDVELHHLKEIERMLTRGERDSPLVFKGRDDFIRHIELRLEAIRDLGPDSGKSHTELIQGAPGAGKTALLNHLQGRIGDTTTVVSLSGSDLENDEHFLAVFLSQLTSETGKLTNTILQNITGVANTGKAKTPYTREREGRSPFDRREILTVWHLIEEGLNSMDKGHTIVLCIDEAQTTPPFPQSDLNQILIDLHTTNTGSLHVLPIFAGLLDTRTVLGRLGMSRQNRKPYQLDALSISESKEVVFGVLGHDALGLAGLFTEEDQDYIATALTVASDQWPRHLHYYINGVLEEILNDHRLKSPRHQINMRRALDYGHESRIDYYEERIESLDSEPLEKALMELAHHQKIPINQLSQLLVSQDTHENDVKTLLNGAIHSGVLNPTLLESGRRVTQMPIPSMRTFFQCQCDRKMTLQKLREILDMQLAI